MDDIYTYITNLPDCVHEMVAPCYDGYTVYINEKLSSDDMYRAYCHAMAHIYRHDFDKQDVQIIETEAHQ